MRCSQFAGIEPAIPAGADARAPGPPPRIVREDMMHLRTTFDRQPAPRFLVRREGGDIRLNARLPSSAIKSLVLRYNNPRRKYMRTLASVFAVAALVTVLGSGLALAQSSGNFSATGTPASCAIG